MKLNDRLKVPQERIDEIFEKLQIDGIKVKAVYEFFVDKGYDVGTYSNFNKYIKNNGLKPTSKTKGHPRFETSPGKQAQADWKEDLKLISKYNEEFIINVFNYKLGNSRYCHFEYKRHRTQQDVFECLIEAFKETGGVPKEILFDNMTTVVDLLNGRRRINTKMQAFADDFGFKISLCKPRRAFTKGKVETANKFIEWLLAYNYEFEDENDLINIIKNIENIRMRLDDSTIIVPTIISSSYTVCGRATYVDNIGAVKDMKNTQINLYCCPGGNCNNNYWVDSCYTDAFGQFCITADSAVILVAEFSISGQTGVVYSLDHDLSAGDYYAYL